MLLLSAALTLALRAEPNPPTWPDAVQVFDPTSTDIEAKVNAAYAENGGKCNSKYRCLF